MRRPFPFFSVEAADHQLMLAVREGNFAALGELFERHHRVLYGYLWRLTGNGAASEDIVQTVFQRILRHRATYRDEGCFAAWMYQLARRAAADFFRKERVTFTLQAEESCLEEHAAEEISPDLETVRGDDLALLERALEALPPADREIIHFAHIENRPHRETAQILECREGAVKVRLHRAMRLLRETYLQLAQPTFSQNDNHRSA